MRAQTARGVVAAVKRCHSVDDRIAKAKRISDEQAVELTLEWLSALDSVRTAAELARRERPRGKR